MPKRTMTVVNLQMSWTILDRDPDMGNYPPFSNELEEERSMEVTSSVFGEVEIGTWMIVWGESMSGFGNVDFHHTIRGEDSTESANATVVARFRRSFTPARTAPGSLSQRIR